MSSGGSNQHPIGVPGFAARWSPDGSRLIFATSFRNPSDIHTSRIDGSDIRPLTSTPANETSPSWSPDGSHVVFISDRDGDRDVFIMDADGTNQRQVTEDLVPEFVPRWSPDGSRIVFGSGLSGIDHREIYVINADGTGLRKVTSTPPGFSAVNPAWRMPPKRGGWRR
jgi:Tol biopolymer transport system component